jgi:hypothetical protein
VVPGDGHEPSHRVLEALRRADVVLPPAQVRVPALEEIAVAGRPHQAGLAAPHIEVACLPLGTRHTVGAYKIAEALHNLRVSDPTGSIRFLLDVTGVGEDVADLIEGYVPSTLKMTRCWFTSTERLDKQAGSGGSASPGWSLA